MATHTDSVTDQEIYELRTECLESLGTLNVSYSSSTSDSSLEKEHDTSRQKKVKRTKALVHSTVYQHSSPYSVPYPMDPMYGYPQQQRPSVHRPSHLYRQAPGPPISYHNYHPYRDNFYSRRQQRERSMAHYGQQYSHYASPGQYPTVIKPLRLLLSRTCPKIALFVNNVLKHGSTYIGSAQW